MTMIKPLGCSLSKTWNVGIYRRNIIDISSIERHQHDNHHKYFISLKFHVFSTFFVDPSAIYWYHTNFSMLSMIVFMPRHTLFNFGFNAKKKLFLNAGPNVTSHPFQCYRRNFWCHFTPFSILDLMPKSNYSNIQGPMLKISPSSPPSPPINSCAGGRGNIY